MRTRPDRTAGPGVTTTGRRGGGTPSWTPPPQDQISRWENMKLTKGDIDLGHFLWLPDPPPSPPSLLTHPWAGPCTHGYREASSNCDCAPGELHNSIALKAAEGGRQRSGPTDDVPLVCQTCH